MAHNVKCLYCGKMFDRDFYPSKKVTSTRYAHWNCAEEKVKEKNPKKEELPTATPIIKEEKEEIDMTNSERDTIKLLDNLQLAILKTITDTGKAEIEKQIIPEMLEEVRKRSGLLPQKHEIKIGEKKKEIIGALHEKFDTVLQLVSCDIPIYLIGAAGTGKNVICKQVAESLGLEFYFTNAVTQEYKLTGFIDANGKYQDTQFYKAFTQGGLFFLDEMDASIPEVLIILNAAIANRYFDFPCGKTEAHPDFRIIAAGNTNGKGANCNYTGRFSLDSASLDRFAFIEIDYSENIERAVTNNNEELIKFCHVFRRISKKTTNDCLFTYRSLERITRLEEIMSDLQTILSISLIKGMNEDDLGIISNEINKESGMKKNKYATALTQLASRF